uniref:Uncharacterized protein n=1 Tax=Chromera velia CCMP2878 TaxID=1169474 RepID=A0A0G4HW85_9ALVE|eukprot:Cvel_9004.t1-p1 / transcript=Cvel_9004.t1 / gene=Cvel_9004 / organism=Chromera_velia_CCMP2878 / gene_product=hypothetical protein / transcript_product=hypothetical protein / location=Cvel_scaffold509:65501-66313(+) / protein_length=271 / sequence_SO=supercontig / SO=protein_coding / is_pseudo=false
MSALGCFDWEDLARKRKVEEAVARHHVSLFQSALEITACSPRLGGSSLLTTEGLPSHLAALVRPSLFLRLSRQAGNFASRAFLSRSRSVKGIEGDIGLSDAEGEGRIWAEFLKTVSSLVDRESVQKGGLDGNAIEGALEQIVKATERFTAVSLGREPLTFVGAWRELLAASPDGGLPSSSVWAVCWRLLWAEGAADSPCALEKLTPLRDVLMESERAWREVKNPRIEGSTNGSSPEEASRMHAVRSATDSVASSAGQLVQILWDLKMYGGW